MVVGNHIQPVSSFSTSPPGSSYSFFVFTLSSLPDITVPLPHSCLSPDLLTSSTTLFRLLTSFHFLPLLSPTRPPIFTANSITVFTLYLIIGLASSFWSSSNSLGIYWNPSILAVVLDHAFSAGVSL